MTSRVPARYLVASLALLVVLVAVHGVSSARRTQAALRAQLADKGRALAEAFEASSRNAIRSNALVEDMIAERLFDNARLVDEMLRRPVAPGEIETIARRNGLRKIDLLDFEGRPWIPPAAEARPPAERHGGTAGPFGPMQRGMTGHMGQMWDAPRGETDAPPHVHRQMMRFMWGRRWGAPPAPEPPDGAPSAIRDRKFWEGTAFGVATSARSFRGIIAVHADADTILRFRREIGVERQLEELGRQPGVSAVALLGPELTVLAHSDASRVGTRVEDPTLADALAHRHTVSRLVERGPRGRVLEVTRPLAVDASRVGLIAIDVSAEPMERAWRHDVASALWLGGGVLAFGILGMGTIFWTQQRHLAEVRALEADKERRERVAALGDVAAAFAHEVRNPLNAVSMGLERLAGEFKPEPAEEYARFVALIQGEVRRLNGIVEQFIALARPVALTPARFALRDLYAEVGALLEPQARGAGVTLRVEPPIDGDTILADRDHLKQVLLNLVLNAVQATAGGGQVLVVAERVHDAIVLTVSDTGRGIAADVLPRIFDPYFTTKRGGLGLGLTITRRIVEAHGGSVAVESQVGRGTRVRVTLPEGGR